MTIFAFIDPKMSKQYLDLDCRRRLDFPGQRSFYIRRFGEEPLGKEKAFRSQKAKILVEWHWQLANVQNPGKPMMLSLSILKR
jgi:hypothetical protein